MNLFKATRKIVYSQTVNGSPQEVWSRFIDFVWKRGAGLKPSIKLEKNGQTNGVGCTRCIPLFKNTVIREKIITADYPCRLYYRVENPSWMTFPVIFHIGWIDFISLGSDSTKVVWTIELIPKPFMELFLRGVMNLMIPLYLRLLARESAQK